MDRRKRWLVFRGRLLIIVGVTALLVAMFLSDQIPAQLTPLVVLFGIVPPRGYVAVMNSVSVI
jgi:hypothetical protein